MSMGWSDTKVHCLALVMYDGQEPEEKIRLLSRQETNFSLKISLISLPVCNFTFYFSGKNLGPKFFHIM